MRTKNRNEIKIARKKSCFCCPQALAVQQCATPRAPRQFAACSLLAKFEALLMLMQINAKVHSTTVAGCRVALLHSSEHAYKTAERNRQPTNVCAHHTPQLCDGAVTAPMRQANAKNAQRNVTWEKIVDFGQNATHTLTHAYIGYTISVKRLNMPMVAANCFFVQQYFCRLAYYWGDIVRRVSRVFKLALNHS